MTKRLIIDASVMLKWMWPEPDSIKAHDIYQHTGHELLAPDYALVEVTNALWKKVKSCDINAEETIVEWMEFKQNNIIEWFETSPYLDRSFTLAQLLNHNSIYDCIYLAMAEQQNCPLLTADQKFLNTLANTPFARYGMALSSPTLH